MNPRGKRGAKAAQPRMSVGEAFVGARPRLPLSKKKNMKKRKEPKKMSKSNQRVVGFDVHPDSFSGALLEGQQDPASARVVSSSTWVALQELEQRVERHTTSRDVPVLKPAATPSRWPIECPRANAGGNPCHILILQTTLDLTTCLHRLVSLLRRRADRRSLRLFARF
jgi:hypothetical protein